MQSVTVHKIPRKIAEENSSDNPGDTPSPLGLPHVPAAHSPALQPRPTAAVQRLYGPQGDAGKPASQPDLTRWNTPSETRQNLESGQVSPREPRPPEPRRNLESGQKLQQGQSSHPSPAGHSTDTALTASAQHQPTNNTLSVPSPAEHEASASTVMENVDRGGFKSGIRVNRFNVTEWEGVQRERQRQLRVGCAEHTVRSRGNTLLNTRSLVDENKRFLYCPVEKSASTFLRRFMYALHHTPHTTVIASPFDIPINTALNHQFVDVRALYKKGKDILKTTSTRFVVVREPFSRLFSAYVDKLLVPNNYYWKAWGTKSISAFRKSPSAHALSCGNDVTFEEFVKYVISTLHKSDEHVKPVDQLCAPCDADFTVIGHTKTLRQDFEYLLAHLGVRVANFSADALSHHVASDAIMDSTFSAFDFYLDLRSCVSLYETCLRLWHKLQLRGIIGEDLTFPFSVEQVEKLNATDMVHVLNEARRNSRDTEKLRQQKKKALREAFASISSGDLQQLAQIYQADFDLFGYDRHPRNSSIFDKKKLDDPTQLILMFEVTDLVGIVSLLYGMLLHSAAPSHRDMATCELSVRTLAITRALGEEGMWLEFRHMASYLILYSSHHLCEDLLHMASYLILYSSHHLCKDLLHMASYLILYSSHHLCEDLLHQVILCMGYFTLLHPDNHGGAAVFQRPPPHCCSLPRPHLLLMQPPLQQTHSRTGAKLCASHQLHRVQCRLDVQISVLLTNFIEVLYSTVQISVLLTNFIEVLYSTVQISVLLTNFIEVLYSTVQISVLHTNFIEVLYSTVQISVLLTNFIEVLYSTVQISVLLTNFIEVLYSTVQISVLLTNFIEVLYSTVQISVLLTNFIEVLYSTVQISVLLTNFIEVLYSTVQISVLLTNFIEVLYSTV
ncbi:hypothetical protein ACOMHN_046588 [Nucella lapillus]